MVFFASVTFFWSPPEIIYLIPPKINITTAIIPTAASRVFVMLVIMPVFPKRSAGTPFPRTSSIAHRGGFSHSIGLMVFSPSAKAWLAKSVAIADAPNRPWPIYLKIFFISSLNLVY